MSVTRRSVFTRLRAPSTALVTLGTSVVLLALSPARAVPQATAGAGRDPGLQRLEAEVARPAGAARGTVGVAAIHLERGRSAYLNRAVAFPMASTYKLPIAVQLLTMVDEGRLRLDSLITVPREDVYRTAGGSRAITGRMRALGLEGVRVDRPTWALISAFVGRPDITEDNRIYLADYLALLSRQRTDKESKLPGSEAMEPVIAQISRAIYDYFAFNPGP